MLDQWVCILLFDEHEHVHVDENDHEYVDEHEYVDVNNEALLV